MEVADYDEQLRGVALLRHCRAESVKGRKPHQKKLKKNLYKSQKAFLMTANMPKKKSTFIGISGLSPKAIEALRARARDNNRSVSGELREIIEAELSQAEQPALNTEP